MLTWRVVSPTLIPVFAAFELRRLLLLCFYLRIMFFSFFYVRIMCFSLFCNLKLRNKFHFIHHPPSFTLNFLNSFLIRCTFRFCQWISINYIPLGSKFSWLSIDIHNILIGRLVQKIQAKNQSTVFFCAPCIYYYTLLLYFLPHPAKSLSFSVWEGA